MNQIFMSNLMSLINTLFPPAVRSILLQLVRELWNSINVAQLHVYFALDDVPFLRWLCPVLEFTDGFIRAVGWFIAYIVKIEVWFLWNLAKIYIQMLRYTIRLFYGYSILLALANMDFSANIPLLEMILQNTEWLYMYAGQFIDFNVVILKKVAENFCSVPLDQRSYFEQNVIGCVQHFVNMVNQFINN